MKKEIGTIIDNKKAIDHIENLDQLSLQEYMGIVDFLDEKIIKRANNRLSVLLINLKERRGQPEEPPKPAPVEVKSPPK